MTSRDFVYWLQGFIELTDNDDAGLSHSQLKCLRAHLALVFKHEIDPSFGPPEKQAELNKIHANPQDALKHTWEHGPNGALIKC